MLLKPLPDVQMKPGNGASVTQVYRQQLEAASRSRAQSVSFAITYNNYTGCFRNNVTPVKGVCM